MTAGWRPDGAALPRELAILHHPDQRTSWAGVLSATLESADPQLPRLVTERLREVSEVIPVLRARWRSGRWELGSPPEPTIDDSDAIAGPAALRRRFSLDREPPIRVVVDTGGQRLLIAAHHAALDGRTAIAVLAALLGQPTSEPPPAAAVAATPTSLRDPLRRLWAPADRIAPSVTPPDDDAFAMRELAVGGSFTGLIAQACVAAAAEHNVRRGLPWRRIGLSVACGGPPGTGNVSSYRRIDLTPGERVAPAVHRALVNMSDPPEMVYAPRALRLLAPIAGRFSDSLLVSNLGEVDLEGIEQLALFPVVHGRSAVGFGVTELRHGRITMCLRARDLTQADAERLLDDAASRLDEIEPRHGLSPIAKQR
jgi:hypothetical protein